MSKVQKENIVKEATVKPKWKDVRENLVVQHAEHLKQVEHHTRMALKAEGAIEVGDQMNPKESDES